MKKQTTLIITLLMAFFLTACNNKTKPPAKIVEEEHIDDIIEAYNYHNNANYFHVTGEGTISSSLITQNLKMEKLKDGNELHYFNASFGSKLGIKINNYVELVGSYDNLYFTKGDTNKQLEKTKETFESEINHESFINLYGVGIDEINYELNKDTIKSIKKENDIYILELDLELSVQKYIKHINETNPYESREDKTKFHSIILEITLDKQNRFKEITIKETYDVETRVITWVKQKLTANIVEQYHYERGEN